MNRLGVIIVAAGAGERMRAGTGTRVVAQSPKQFLPLAGRPILAWSVEAFCGAAEIVVALPPGMLDSFDASPHKTCEGGASRTASVRNALQQLSPDCDLIAVHDAARPLVSRELIARAIATARAHGSAVPVVSLNDSIRRTTAPETPNQTSTPVDRSSLRAVQTPQIFRADILRRAYENATEDFSDDASLVEAAGFPVTLCEGERRNIKITEPLDLLVAQTILDNDSNSF